MLLFHEGKKRCDSLSQLNNLFLRVFANVILLVVHSNDSSVDGEQRPLQALRDRTIEILAFIFRHLENDQCRIADRILL